MSARIVSSLIISIALSFAIGCSKSSTTQASFESSSDSSSSPFESSSKSSGSDDEKKENGGDTEKKETAFQRDVRNHTAAFARPVTKPDLDSFRRDLGVIAEDHGITNWEQFADTYVAIGRGLADSGLDEWSAQQLATDLSGEDIEHLALVRSGYENRNLQ